MKRIFHARITWYQYLYLVILGAAAFWLLWQKAIVPAAMCMLLIVFLIERLIHTTYTITADDMLVVCTGRFSKTRAINIHEIRDVQKRFSPVGRLTKTGYVLIEFGHEKYISLLPLKEQEFLDLLEKRRLRVRD